MLYFFSRGYPISITDNGNTPTSLKAVQKDKKKEQFSS
jgi:hypothetical protein